MSLKPQPVEFKEQKLIPSGSHVGILYSIIDLGTHHDPKWNTNKQKVRFTWELPNELLEFEKDGVKKTLPMAIGREFTNSMSDMGNLLPVIEGLLGKKLTEAQAADWDVERFKELLGTASILSVVHSSKGEKTYANIASVSPLMKGMEKPKQTNPSVLFELEGHTQADLDKLPKFIREKIAKSNEVTGITPKGNSEEDSVMDLANEMMSDIKPEDIPFN